MKSLGFGFFSIRTTGHNFLKTQSAKRVMGTRMMQLGISVVYEQHQ